MRMVLKILIMISLNVGFIVANEHDMGDEDKLFEKIKKDILNSSKVMVFSEECFVLADTLEKANKCVEEGNKISKDNLNHIRNWTKEDKNEMLQNIRIFNKSIPCIKNAQTMDSLQKCLPQEVR